MTSPPDPNRLSYHFWGRSGGHPPNLLICIRSDWIRTSDPYPPRKLTQAKLLIYRAVRCVPVRLAFATCPMFPYQSVSRRHQ